ncbi:MAG: hypothetical protein HY235_30210 [Acidobacteria bacterium]|nr:hypothetical protein [Acidobacteriota bacterium]
MRRNISQQIDRRGFLAAIGLGAGASVVSGQQTYETHAKGIRIVPGQWRPHYRFEQIAWISPPWPSQDYLWLDFPEAIFSSRGLLFLSHVNPPLPQLFPDLPQAPWRTTSSGIAFERSLPNAVAFGGRIEKLAGSVVELELHISNGSREPLTNITLQTCAYLRGIREFADFTRSNKFVHLPGSGWTPLSEALTSRREESAAYRVGWRTKGKAIADQPWLVTLSNQGERLVAMTWGKDTLSLIANPNHPCMHADPHFPDLKPGASASVKGLIVFFEGALRDFRFENSTGTSTECAFSG